MLHGGVLAQCDILSHPTGVLELIGSFGQVQRGILDCGQLFKASKYWVVNKASK